MKYAKIFTTLILLIFIQNLSSAQNTYFDFAKKNGKSKIYYKVVSKMPLQVKVTGKNTEYGSYKGDIQIPDTVRYRGKTYDVVAVGDSAFFGCDELNSVTLPESIKSVGRNAFDLCSVNEVNFPSSIERIEDMAFRDCMAVKEFYVNENLKYIGDYAFSGSEIKTLTVSSPYMQSNTAFNNINSLEKIIIEENVENITEKLFYGCNNVKTLIFNAKNFQGVSPFKSFASLDSVSIGKNVSLIPQEFIADCINIKDINIPENTKVLMPYAFANTGISFIELKPGTEQMGQGIFSGCRNLEEVLLPENLGIIVESMFENCDNLQYLNLPEGMTEIDSAAFKNCKSLSTVVLPESINYIGKDAFVGCNSLKDLTVKAKTPPIVADDLQLNATCVVNIDCNYIIKYKSSAFWENLSYPCDMNNVTVSKTAEREVFDKTRGQMFKEKIITAGDFSYIITNERQKYVSMTDMGVNYFDNITRSIEIPSQISDNEIIYTVTGIKSVGICKSIFIPATVRSIDTMSFGQKDLQEIQVSKDNPYFTSIDGILYDKKADILIAYPSYKAENQTEEGIVTLPESVKMIGYGAFSDCKNVVLKIGKNISSIGANQQVKRFVVSEDNEDFFTDGHIIYNKNKTQIYTCIKNYAPKNRVLQIDSLVAVIDDKAFYTTKFDTLKVSCVYPPEIFANTFNLDKSFVCVVPYGSLKDYKNEEFWEDMNLIEQSSPKVTRKGKTTKKKSTSAKKKS